MLPERIPVDLYSARPDVDRTNPEYIARVLAESRELVQRTHEVLEASARLMARMRAEAQWRRAQRLAEGS